MYGKVALIAILLFAVVAAVSPSHGRPSHKGTQKSSQKIQPHKPELQNIDPWEVCFYTNWAQYRAEPATFHPEDIDVNLCTHIFFAFANMDENDLVPYEPNDVDMYQRIMALKTQKPSLEVYLAVGGWTFGTAKMTLMMSSQENRTEFINNVISYLNAYGFDGVDLDFEYPASRGSPAIDKAQFTCLLEEMRAAFDDHNSNNANILNMTAGVAAGMDAVQPGYDILRICNVLDKVNLMSYDFFGVWDATANPHSPLYSRTEQSNVDKQKTVEYSANYWSRMGCPRHKINIGIATYGRSFTLTIPGQGDMGAPISDPGNPGQYTQTPGIINYYEMCSEIFPTATIRYHPEHFVPYANTTTQWVGYDDPTSANTKGEWIKDNGFGGFMLWSLDHDDFGGLFCNQGPYPILTALHNSMAGYQAPNDPITPPEPIPDPNPNYCQQNQLSNGYHKDYYTCSRCYECIDGATNVIQCTAGEIIDPRTFPSQANCVPIGVIDQDTLCINCFELCDCNTLVTPLDDTVSET